MQTIQDSTSYPRTACVATIGFFDGVHRGHQHLLDQVKAASQARGWPSAVVTFVAPPIQTIRPEVQPQLLTAPDVKVSLLEEAGIDLCFLITFTPELANHTAESFMREVLQARCGVHALCIGYDHRFGKGRSEGMADYLRYGAAMGMEVIPASAAYLENSNTEGEPTPISSSLIRRLLHAGDVWQAATLLGRPYRWRGTVTRGHQIGRTLGFPTANVVPCYEPQLIPANGVYAVEVCIEGQWYGGMLNIGTRPTVNNGPNRTIEVHIFQFQGSLYDCCIELSFVQRIREERRFESLAQLTEQLHLDQAVAQHWLTK